ncbi:MAG: hypothetical protein IJU26_00780 [Synergistaceae bacterium]|nr:hypothetical protein [Synergistaceae bacterium]
MLLFSGVQAKNFGRVLWVGLVWSGLVKTIALSFIAIKTPFTDLLRKL